MPDTDAEKVRELAAQLDDAAGEEEGEGHVASRGLGLPAAVTISPIAQRVLKMLYGYLPTLFPWLIE
jgi:hypothetical protein